MPVVTLVPIVIATFRAASSKIEQGIAQHADMVLGCERRQAALVRSYALQDESQCIFRARRAVVQFLESEMLFVRADVGRPLTRTISGSGIQTSFSSGGFPALTSWAQGPLSSWGESSPTVHR